MLRPLALRPYTRRAHLSFRFISFGGGHMVVKLVQRMRSPWNREILGSQWRLEVRKRARSRAGSKACRLLCPTPAGQKPPVFLGGARKIIRTRAIKNRRVFASKTQKSLYMALIAARAAQNPGSCSAKPRFLHQQPTLFFSRLRAKNSLFLGGAQLRQKRQNLCPVLGCGVGLRQEASAQLSLLLCLEGGSSRGSWRGAFHQDSNWRMPA